MISNKRLNQIINESINKVLLREFMQDGFSFDDLDKCATSKEKVRYCRKYLGDPCGSPGSSRIVFEIDDYQVLKVAYGHYEEAGRKQNEREFTFSHNVKSPLLVKTLYHAKDWSWIVSERVLPCTSDDFHKLLGVGYEGSAKFENDNDNYSGEVGYKEYSIDKEINDEGEVVNFEDVMCVIDALCLGAYMEHLVLQYPRECYLIQNHPWFNEMYKLCLHDDLIPTDVNISNLGIGIRNGKPTIVVLDSGIDLDIGIKYYCW